MRHSYHDRIAISHDHLYRSRDRFAGWPGGCNLPGGAGVNGRDAWLWRFAGLFPSPGQFVREDQGNSRRFIWGAGLFQRVRLRYIRGVRIRARADISHSHGWRDVSLHTLVSLRSSLPAPRILPLLPVLCSNHVFACGPRDRSAAGATQISLISCLLSGLAHFLALRHAR